MSRISSAFIAMATSLALVLSLFTDAYKTNTGKQKQP
jgi:hypothetical protein